MVPRTLLIFILVALGMACTSEGAAGISDQLSWAANRMNLLGGDERSVVYKHRAGRPYWIVAAPPGTTAEDLIALKLPTGVEEKVQQCREQGGAFIAVADDMSSSCVWPVSFPEVVRLEHIAKQSMESTQFVVRRKGSGLYLAEIK